MSWLLDKLVGALLALVTWRINFNNGIRPRRDDDPWTAECKFWRRASLYSLGIGSFVAVVAYAMGSVLETVGARATATQPMEPFQSLLLFVAAATLSLSALSMAYCGYRLYRLERD